MPVDNEAEEAMRPMPIPPGLSWEQSQIMLYQQQLHMDNQRRMRTLENGQRDMGTKLEQLVLNTSSVGGLKESVESHEKDINRGKGALGLLTFLIGAWEVIKWLVFKR